MPSVYEASCSHCGFRSGAFPEGYGAVWLDEAVEGARPLVAGMAATTDRFATTTDARLVVLAHPLEESILKEIGYTQMRLLCEGRFVWVNNVLCAACGHLYGRRRLQAPGGVGCVSTLLVALLAGAVVSFARSNVAAGLAAGMVTILVVSFFVEALAYSYTRVRFRERARVVASVRACPRCSSSAQCKPQTSQLLPCPECRAVTLSGTCVGRS